jgi:hypothetical protein
VTSNARKRIEALEKLRADRLAEQARRSSAAERFARKLEKMTAVERAEIEAIQSHWENMADQLGLRQPLGREDQLTVLRNTPAEIRRRYREILDRYPD